ncbi:MAG: formyltransferase family protein [bacterium]|nr:formyltransferase family protein [bacterium]
MGRPKVIVFASGTKENGLPARGAQAGGSGFENLVEASHAGILDADIVAVVSNHEHGGVRERADRLGIPFVYFSPSEHSNILKNVGMSYEQVVRKRGAEWVALSGWFKHVQGLDPRRTFNIHPALLSQLGGRFGGKGMYGHREHAAVKAANDAGEITESGVSMHFVTDEYDRGPVFFEYRIPLKKGMTADEIQSAVQSVEHEWQPRITNMVVHGEIAWDGKNPESLVVPKGYQYLPRR